MAAGPVSQFDKFILTDEANAGRNQIDGEILLSDSDEEDKDDVAIATMKVKKPDAHTANDSKGEISSHRSSSQNSGFSNEDFEEETLAIQTVRSNRHNNVIRNGTKSRVSKA